MVTAEFAELAGSSAQESCFEAFRENYYSASGNRTNFDTLFGRDGAIAAIIRSDRLARDLSSIPPETLSAYPLALKKDRGSKPSVLTFEDRLLIKNTLQPVVATLKTLGSLQGTKTDDWNDEEEGKIPHEYRVWEPQEKGNGITFNNRILRKLARAGWPVRENGMLYYGSIDATPLYIVACEQYVSLTGDFAFFRQEDPHIRAAVEWILRKRQEHGDLYLGYEAKNKFALKNQGWKDSGDSILTPEGEEVKKPIALVEVQGYQYMALLRAAKLYENNDAEFSVKLRSAADELKRKFNQDYWMEDEGYFAYALDGDGNQVKDIVSNVGHLFMTGIIDDDKIGTVVKRFMRPDLYTRYGARTLSSDSPNYSEKEPCAYHNGSIWPHDNAIICIGLIKAGFAQQAQMIREANLEALKVLWEKYGIVKPVECFIFTRNGVLRPYKTAQIPQTWAAEAVLSWTDGKWPPPTAA